MTLEQMEKVLMDNVPAKFGRDEIRAALRAGQTFRNRCRCVQPQMSGYAPYCANAQDTTAFVKAWDAALGGGEGMTNKQERYFVVSEEEMQERIDAAMVLTEDPNAENVARYRKISAACRAREVQNVYIGAKRHEKLWQEIKR